MKNSSLPKPSGALSRVSPSWKHEDAQRIVELKTETKSGHRDAQSLLNTVDLAAPQASNRPERWPRTRDKSAKTNRPWPGSEYLIRCAQESNTGKGWRAWIEKPVENRLVFVKIGETSPDRFHWFLITRPVNLFFLNENFKIIYLFRYQFTNNTDR
jgi:hypothetical protein